MSIHIGANKGDIAETVLLPGDPLRAKFMAQKYLEDITCYNEVRGMLGYTGTYKGKRISIQGTGMGIPSISIYAHELINEYGVKNLMRVGSCGSYQTEVKLRDIILAQATCCDASFNKYSFEGRDYSPIANFDMLVDAKRISDEKGLTTHVGNVHTSDIFYNENTECWKMWKNHGVLAVEMETAALYTLAARFNVKALSLLTVSDHLVTGEKTTSQERQETFHEMVEVALDVACRLT